MGVGGTRLALIRGTEDQKPARGQLLLQPLVEAAGAEPSVGSREPHSLEHFRLAWADRGADRLTLRRKYHASSSSEGCHGTADPHGRTSSPNPHAINSLRISSAISPLDTTW